MTHKNADFKVDGKYGIAELVDLAQLRVLFEQFTKATGFTIGFLDHPELNLLISSGWRDICTKFHRSCPGSIALCTKSNRRLLDNLDEPGQVIIDACDNGLVDCATPIIIKGKHIASLSTGQMLLEKPDIERFKRQARLFGFDEEAYLRALQEIPVISEERLKAVTTFLGQMAIMISQTGYARLTAQEESGRLEKEASERKRAENALKDSEELYSDLIKCQGAGIYRIRVNRDPAWQSPDKPPYVYEFMSDPYCELFGFSRKEFMRNPGITMSQIHPEDKALFLQLNEHAARALEPFVWEGRMILKGQTRWIHFDSRPRLLDSGDAVWTGIAFDITTLKQTEHGLKESLSLLEATLESTADGILVVDAAGKIVRFNKMFASMWQLPETVLASTNDNDAVDFVLNQLVDPEQFRSKIRELYTHPEATSVDMLKFRDGRVFARYSQPQRIGGVTVGRVWSFRDITERNRAEVALRAKTDELNRFFDTTLDLLCIANTDGMFLRLNKQWEKTLGYSIDELLSKRFLEFIHPDDVESTLKAVAKLSAQIEVQNFVNRYRHQDGSYRWIAWRAVPVGSLIYAAAHDITDERLMEDRLRQAEKLTAIGQLAGGVAHDFNNQLTGIMGYADMLVTSLAEDDLRRHAQGILDAARRAADLTHKLLAFARKGKFLAVPVDVHSLLSEMESIVTRAIDKRIRIIRDFKADTPMILGDPTQLHNVFLNLALNARDAMPDGGELTLKTEMTDVDNQHCKKSLIKIVPGRYLNVSIVDTGCGMTAEVKKHLFEPFFTTKRPGEGTGMGLASVYGAVQNHHGTISIHSTPGHGTTVSLLLPVLSGVPAPSAPPPADLPVHGKENILIVDDEEMIRKICTLLLERLGYTVMSCSNGREAVEYYRHHWRETDLVILDMVMPEMNGHAAFIAMREINPKVRALLSSGYSLDGEAQAILDEGVLGFVGKPYQQTQLSQKVAAALSRNDAVANM